LIQEKYSYADTSGQEQYVPIVGFAYPSYDCRNACITAIDAELLEKPAFEIKANSCRNIGAPLLFICCRKELQWWGLTTKGAEFKDSVSINQIDNFFKQHRKEFSPRSIYRAKNLSRVHSDYQLKFVDRGLMPVLEHEMGDRLADLIKNMLGVLDDELGRPQEDIKLKRWMFQCAFWLLGAKILQDKKVKNFIKLELEDISAVLERVNQHYGTKDGLVSRTRRQQHALEAASKLAKRFASLENLTIESLAYVYENTLIDKGTRKAWGIHATPSYLIDYIVWQLFDWIRDIPQGKRIVLEPTCGHAPFLLSALRLLREMYEGDKTDLHKYLKNHLLGIEQDSFAREIARLSLTLADVPNPNGWKLKEDDVYQGNVLSKLASKSTILLCNPPFQNFTPKEQSFYQEKGKQLNCFNKAAEVLWRTLPHMSKGSVFGVILPQGFLHKSNLAQLRKIIVEEFELAEICALPENVFSFGRHKSTVLLGRKRTGAKKTFVLSNEVRFRRVQKWELDRFRESYQTATEQIFQAEFDIPVMYDFRLGLLHEVWKYCRSFSCLVKVVEAGRGLEYKRKPKKGEAFNIKKHLPPNAQTISKRRFAGSVRGYDKFARDIMLTDTPELFWVNLACEVISRPRWGTEAGIPQVLLNSLRVGHGPWRLKALIDSKGYPVTTRFIVVRPKTEEWSLKVLWAILNSPLANAYAYCHSLERNNQTGMIRSIPIPDCDSYSLRRLANLVQDYFNLYDSQGKVLESDVDTRKVKRQMLAIDAEVMRLYDLPPRLERQVLDLFAGWPRKGVDFKFECYFPKDLESWIPLHEYLSEEYQRSTVSFVNKWVEEVKSPEIIKAFKAAEEAFKED
jgi:type I restriction-modification system DNA methylase subunit